MNITIDRHSRNARRIEDRIREIGDHAGRLAARHLGGRLPAVDIIITDGKGVAASTQLADHSVAGKPTQRRYIGRTIEHWRGRTAAASTALTPHGARDRHIAYLRQQYGITPHSKTDQREYERLIDIREQQAANLENLARQLPNH
ncbi:hypothetical protein [Streptomyces sp. NPDC015125]|uniref:hypothetical protein n=1 Tax=Streptomyces sp. NPDC015125 TaxID=3364938 RepID=UPI0036FFEFB6